jgi:predicted signal transduction protein with EAL and GGDEF domain
MQEGGAIAARLVDAVSQLRFATPHEIVKVGCSIGVAEYPQHAGSADELIACADSAMYLAKQNGKNGWRPYQRDAQRPETDAMQTALNARLPKGFATRNTTD